MKKIKSMLACLLAFTFLMGMQVSAADGTEPTLSVNLNSNLTDGKAEVGEELNFTIDLDVPADNAEAVGSYLRFYVCDESDMSADSRIGTPNIIDKESGMFTDTNNALGLTTARIGQAGEGKVTVAFAITEEMKGKTLYYKADVKTDAGTDNAVLAETDVKSFEIAEDSTPAPMLNLTMNAKIDVEDVDNIPLDTDIPITLTISNIGEADISHLYVISGYNETGWNSPDDMEPFGTFVDLPDNAELREDVVYIPMLTKGSHITLKLTGKIPESYNKEDISFAFAAVSYGKEEFDEAEEPSTQLLYSTSGKIAASETPAPTPGNPEEENPPTTKPETNPPQTDPAQTAGNNNVQAQPAAKEAVNTKAAPKTGDTNSVAMAVILMGAAGITAVIAGKKSRA